MLEDNDLLLDMQYGSRTGRMSISPILLKVLTYDIARMNRMVIAIIENDAIGCYDRIANRLGYLLLRRLGMDDSAIQSLGLTWAGMKHIIST